MIFRQTMALAHQATSSSHSRWLWRMLPVHTHQLGDGHLPVEPATLDHLVLLSLPRDQPDLYL